MSEETQLNLILVTALLIFSALIACFETSLTAVSRAKINRMRNEGNKRAKILDKLLKEREKVVGVMLLGNNVVNIIASAITTKVLLELFGEIGVVYASVFLTIVIIVFGEILPKTYAIKDPERITLFFAPVINFLFTIFSPLILIIQKIVNVFINLLLAKSSQRSKQSELEEIRDTVELKHKEGSIFKYDKDLLDGVLDLADTEISEIMVHRKNIESLNIELPLEEIINQAININYTRIPLWKGNKENVIAILNVRKLLKALRRNENGKGKFDLLSVTSQPWFIPASNSLRAQLFAFRKRRKRFALVVDEYGSLVGLVTLEDILEEIVGEIKEQEDNSEINIIRIKSGAYKITGKMLIRDINKKLDWDIEEDDHAYNLAAFVINNLGRIPEEKENFVIGDYYFEILKKQNHDLILIKVKKLTRSEEATSN